MNLFDNINTVGMNSGTVGALMVGSLSTAKGWELTDQEMTDSLEEGWKYKEKFSNSVVSMNRFEHEGQCLPDVFT